MKSKAKTPLRQKMDAIFRNPTRHRFLSFSEANKAESWDGSFRVNTEEESQLTCILCGNGRKGHAETDEIIGEIPCEKST
jgi:hypothetical protein